MGVGVGSSPSLGPGRLGLRSFALSTAASADDVEGTLWFVAEGGVAGAMGAVRGAAGGGFGEGVITGAVVTGAVATGVGKGTLGGGVMGGFTVGKVGRCFTTDSGCVDGVAVGAGVFTRGGGTLRAG